MKPSSDHEREIARRVDALAIENRLAPADLAQVVIAIPFPMSELETRFLIEYIAWRQRHPIKQ